MRTVTAIASLLALASGALSQGCYEAIRFGQTTISPGYPKAVKPGDVLSITTNFTCTEQYLRVKRVSVDYLLLSNTPSNTLVQEIFLTRRGNTSTIDKFTTKLPLFPKYNSSLSYTVYAKLLYPITDNDGKEVFVTAGGTNIINLTTTA